MPNKEDCLSVLKTARRYTLELIRDIDSTDWYRLPSGCPTHVAWQVGHVTYAQLAVALQRTRGEQPGDQEVLPEVYAELFGKGSEPVEDPTRYPSVQELTDTMHRVHEYVLAQLQDEPETFFEQTPVVEFLGLKTRAEVIRFCALHEMLHAGQIGLLRRMLGKAPLR